MIHQIVNDAWNIIWWLLGIIGTACVAMGWLAHKWIKRGMPPD